MCYETSARPPYPPIAGGAATGERMTLTSQDGTTFAAFTAQAEAPSDRGIVVLPDIRGLHPFYEDLALRFAEAGITAVAMDYFGRTAGVAYRDDDFEWMPHVQQTHPDTVAADVAACVAHLKRSGVTKLYTVGFCFGGLHSFIQAARDHGLSGVIGFYGRPRGRIDDDPHAPIALAPEMACPVLGLFGGSDPIIPSEDVDDLRSALDAHRVPNEVVVYDGAPHSFFDRAADAFKDECDDAWRRILRFVG